MFGKLIVFALLATTLAYYEALEPRAAIEAIANATDEAVRSDMIIEEILLDGEASPVHVEDAYEMGKMESTHESITPDLEIVVFPIESEMTGEESTLEGQETPREESVLEGEKPLTGNGSIVESEMPTVEGEKPLTGEESTIEAEKPLIGEGLTMEKPTIEAEKPLTGEQSTIEAEMPTVESEKPLTGEESTMESEMPTTESEKPLTGEESTIDQVTELTGAEHVDEEQMSRLSRSADNATEVVPPVMIEEPMTDKTVVDDSELMVETPETTEEATAETVIRARRSIVAENATELIEETPAVEESTVEEEELVARIERSVVAENATELVGESTVEEPTMEEEELVARIERSVVAENATELIEEKPLVQEPVVEKEVSRIERSIVAENATELVEESTVEEKELVARMERSVVAENATELIEETPLIEEPTTEMEDEDSTDFEIFDRLERAAGNESESSGNGTCRGNEVCYSDKECGGEGRCLGLFVGKCNCDACFNFMTCSDDSACGGLKNACNATESRCNCIEGHKANGFPLFIDALRELCNVKECNAESDTCFGLPCRSGRCVC